MMLLGGLALANRAGFSLISTAYERQGWQARVSAEAGADRIVEELNEQPNRGYLLSSTTSRSNSIWSQAEASVRSSPCTTTASTVSPSNRQIGLVSSTPSSTPYTTNWVYLDSSGKVVSNISSATTAYRLLSISRPPQSNLNLLADSRDNGWGRFSLVVQGGRVMNGTIISTVKVEKEYQVMPKCCNLSFGSPHGRLTYTFTGSGSQDCLTNSLGFGLIGGAAENDTGSVTLLGNTEAFTPGGTPVPIVYCIVSLSVSGNCTAVDNASALSIKNVPADLPNVPLPPSPLTIPCPSGTTGTCLANTSTIPPISISLSSATSINKNNACTNFVCSTRVANGNGPDDTIILNAGVSSIPTGCTEITAGSTSTNGKPATGNELHCIISRLDYNGKNLRIATNGRKLRLYFVDADPSTNTGIIEANGNEVISSCTTATATDTCLSPSNLTDISLFGCPSTIQTTLRTSTGAAKTCTPQTIKLAGTPAAGSGGGFFVWFPQGNIDLRGTAGFTGVAWGNTVRAGGTVDFIVPGAGLGNVLDYTGFLDPTKPNGGGTFPLIDFIARAVSNFKWSGN